MSRSRAGVDRFAQQLVFLDDPVARSAAPVRTTIVASHVRQLSGKRGGKKLPSSAPRPKAEADLDQWLQSLLDEYVGLIYTERPRRSEYKKLMQSLTRAEGMSLRDIEAVERLAASTLHRADVAKGKAEAIARRLREAMTP